MSIKILKLITAEEIIAEVVHEDGVRIAIKNPILLMLQPKQDGSFGVAMLPYASNTPKDSEIVIPFIHVIYVTDAREELVDKYSEVFSKVVPIRKPGLVVPG